jgi:hypothetical protein
MSADAIDIGPADVLRCTPGSSTDGVAASPTIRAGHSQMATSAPVMIAGPIGTCTRPPSDGPPAIRSPIAFLVVEQLPHDHQDRPSDGDDCSLLPAPAGDSPVPLTKERLVSRQPMAASPRARAR